MASRRLKLPFTLTEDDVLPFLGSKADALTPQLRDLLQNTMKKVGSLAEPQGVYADFKVRSITEERLELDGTSLRIQGRQTMRHFSTSQRVTLLAVTLGERVAATLSQLSSTRIGEALIFDAVASAATENLAEQLDALISGEIRRQGFFPTARFSPGYGDWDLAWQKELVNSLQGDQIGLRVTPYSLLEPVKSITAAIGWSSTPILRNYETPVRKKPCQGTLSCSQCPLQGYCH